MKHQHEKLLLAYILNMNGPSLHPLVQEVWDKHHQELVRDIQEESVMSQAVLNNIPVSAAESILRAVLHEQGVPILEERMFVLLRRQMRQLERRRVDDGRRPYRLAQQIHELPAILETERAVA